MKLMPTFRNGSADRKQPDSRLRKKLSIYFILIAVVSISVSMQIILEVSSPRFRTEIARNTVEQLRKKHPDASIAAIDASAIAEGAAKEISRLRNRMLLMLGVVSLSIIGAFTMFARDIVNPMDLLVDATKRIAAGDLSAHAPVISDDEIGQMANLVNDMNIGLQDMIKQMRRELDNYNVKLAYAVSQLAEASGVPESAGVIESRRMKLSDFKRLMDKHREVEKLLNRMSNDIMSLHSFMDTYRTYTIASEVTQKEIDETLSHYGAHHDQANEGV